jgi:signal transduction histidine kinase
MYLQNAPPIVWSPSIVKTGMGTFVVGEGSGLGPAIVRDLAQGYGGSIVLE